MILGEVKWKLFIKEHQLKTTTAQQCQLLCSIFWYHMPSTICYLLRNRGFQHPFQTNYSSNNSVFHRGLLLQIFLKNANPAIYLLASKTKAKICICLKIARCSHLYLTNIPTFVIPFLPQSFTKLLVGILSQHGFYVVKQSFW